MRLIDGDLLYREIDYNWKGIGSANVADILELIFNAATIEPENLVEHGKWIVEGQTWLTEEAHCSECLWIDTFPKGNEKYNYCPGCGTKMN